MANQQRQFQDGWLTGRKAIAAYLGVHPDTVRRWEDEKGLLVFDAPGGYKVGLKHVLDQWLIEYNRLKRKK
jgi:hypothetical protein